jgi:hypothetical protein
MKEKHYSISYSIVGLLLCLFVLASDVTNAQQASKQYKKISRDPFLKYKPPVRVPPPPKAVPMPITPPSIQERIDRYKTLKASAMSVQQPAPKATTALLLNELDIIGIFRTPRGYAAMVEAKPIKLSYVIYPGEIFYDGQLVAVEENRLVFRHETKWTNGKIDKSIQMKSLRQANAVTESLAATRSDSSNSPTAEAATTTAAPSSSSSSNTSSSQKSSEKAATPGNK